MKLLLHVYTGEWANTDIQAAWLELNLEYINALQTLGKACEKLPAVYGMTVSSLTYVDPSPDFLESWDIDSDDSLPYHLIDNENNEIELYDVDEWLVLRDDQTFPEDAPQKMTCTFLNVEKQGVWWESRDDATEDKVETALITWAALEQFKQQLEAAQDGSNAQDQPRRDGDSAAV